ncbi:MAG: glycosyltransferase family 4 protein [Terriglobia bacterium]
MKIVLVHNFYQLPGGEDRVYAQERELLESRGHEVVTYQRSNIETLQYSPFQRLSLPKRMFWAADTHQAVRELLGKEKPDIVHVHNTFFQISPSIFAACQEAGVPVVQTLHNFRLMCPAATFFREGKVCEQCRESSLWQGVRHACYRKSRGATAAVALMLAVHRKARTWIDKVTLHIALTQFARRKFTEGGLPEAKIRVKPNFVSVDPGQRNGMGDGAVFVGRLSPEKGLKTLLRAWGQLRLSVPLRIIGDGPLRGELEQMAYDLKLSHATFVGHADHDATQSAIKNARFLVLPSECYENFPLTLVEALSCGTPVICSRLGAMQEIITDGETGLHFTPGRPEELADKVAWAWDHSQQVAEMGKAGRRDYEQKYTAGNNYESLMSIYRQAIAASR